MDKYRTVEFDGVKCSFRRPVIAILRKNEALGRYLDPAELQKAIESDEGYAKFSAQWETFRKSAFSEGGFIPPVLDECELAEAIYAIASFFAYVGRPMNGQSALPTLTASPSPVGPESTNDIKSSTSSLSSPEAT